MSCLSKIWTLCYGMVYRYTINEEREVNYGEVKLDFTMLLTYNDCGEANQNSLWYLDSDTSNHMCGKKELFTTLDKFSKEKSLLEIQQRNP